MNISALVDEINTSGVFLTVVNGKLKGRNFSSLSESLLHEIGENKVDLVNFLSKEKAKPYIKENGELIIPFDCEPKYRWWAGGQSVRATLLELNAQQEVLCNYMDTFKDF